MQGNKHIIGYENNSGDGDFDSADLLEMLLPLALNAVGIDFPVEISCTIVNNNEIQGLNKKLRGVDRPTDVLSFPLYHNAGEIKRGYELSHNPPHLGDIVISAEKCREQAGEYGHSLLRERGFLTLHGLLHLLGFDHVEEKEEKEMNSRQEEILNQANIKR